MFTKLKCKLTAWIEGFLYFSMADEERCKYTAVCNREALRKERAGRSKKDSDDYQESFEGYCLLVDSRDVSIAHEEMVKKCLFFEVIERTVKEIKIRAAEKNKE